MSERQWEKFIPDDCGGWKNVGDLKTDAEVLAEIDTETLVEELNRRGVLSWDDFGGHPAIVKETNDE